MKAARYFLVGATHSILAKRQDHTFYIFGEVSGTWKQSALAVNLVMFEVAKEISKSDAEAFAKSKIPGADVKRFMAELPPRRSTEEVWKPLDVADMVETWQKEARQEIATHRGK